MTVRFLLIPALWLLHSAPTYSALLLSRNSEWKYLKGTAEASDPLEAWRAVNFDDSSWDIGSTPIRYGDGNGGTVLNDMRGNYTTVFMRRTFNVSNISEISTLNLNVDWENSSTLTEAERDESYDCFDTEDFQIGFKAFLAKKKPEFEGR